MISPAQSLLPQLQYISVFMQSEPIAISRKTLPVDSSQANDTSTQHGNDSADGSVSGSLDRESARDKPAPGQSDSCAASLNDVGSAPPSPAQRVIQHENAGMSSKKSAAPGFRVVPSAGMFDLPLESLPNGM